MFEPDLNENALHRLLSRSEDHLIDFKRAHLPLAMPDQQREQKRGEWMKDILAFANTRRTRSAYVLVGVSDDRSVVGICESRDDASFQMLFRDQANRVPVFRYYEVVLKSSERIGVFEIAAEQPRPIYLKRSIGPTCECVVYIRQGSTNAPLEPDRWRELYPLPATSTPVAATDSEGVRKLVTRWVGLFETHGVKHHQIPRLLPNHYLPVAALADWTQTATLLSDTLLEDTSKLFNVRRDWLDGDIDQIYDIIPLIYDVRGLLQVLDEWIPSCDEVAMLGFREHAKPLEERRRQRCAFMLRGTICEFGEKPVFKYQPLYAEFDWEYDKGRLIAKIAWLAARLAGCQSWGWVLNREEISALCCGSVFPDTILTTDWSGIWHPEDFVFPPSESAVAKEIHEYPHVVEVARKNGVTAKALRISQKKPVDPISAEWFQHGRRGRPWYVDGNSDPRDEGLPPERD